PGVTPQAPLEQERISLSRSKNSRGILRIAQAHLRIAVSLPKLALQEEPVLRASWLSPTGARVRVFLSFESTPARPRAPLTGSPLQQTVESILPGAHSTRSLRRRHDRDFPTADSVRARD